MLKSLRNADASWLGKADSRERTLEFEGKNMLKHYDGKFFKYEMDSSTKSAKEIVPLILELINPKSVIDIGCGVGSWLALFRQYGVKDVLGVDGEWVDHKRLQIPKEQFISFDLTKPFRVNRKFDVVISLEVAEHIPAKYAETLVDTLVSFGPIILFSAAIPFQGGACHINEQWPNYWAKLFLKRGYLAIDCIRKRIWLNSNVDIWYAQNILIFAKKSTVENNPLLRKEFENTNASLLSIVHPKLWLARVPPSFRERFIQFVRKVVSSSHLTFQKD